MKNILYVVIIFIMLFSQCDPNNLKLRLINNTNDTVYYRLLTDTILNKDIYLYNLSPLDTIWPNFVMGKGEGVWEYKINHDSKDSTLQIFIFNTSKLHDSIIKYNIYKRKGFKVDELDSLNWIVTYPDDFE